MCRLVFLFPIFTLVFAKNATKISARLKRWNGPPPAPYVPNSNIAIGYPTAYGLGNYVRPPPPFGDNGYGSGAPNSRGFPVRCSNGGAHIGQCRLDDDAICVALGGTCVNSACCTTPFISLLTVTPKSTTSKPDLVDGEAMTSRPRSEESEEIDEDEEDEEMRHKETRSEERRRADEERRNELLELAKLIDLSRFYTTPAPLTQSTSPEVSVHWTHQGLILSTTTSIPLIRQTELPKIETTSLATTTESEIDRFTPDNSVEVEEATDGYQIKVCDSGLKPVGPCDENEQCPENHFCENGEYCCFSYFW